MNTIKFICEAKNCKNKREEFELFCSDHEYGKSINKEKKECIKDECKNDCEEADDGVKDYCSGHRVFEECAKRMCCSHAMITASIYCQKHYMIEVAKHRIYLTGWTNLVSRFYHYIFSR